MLKLTLEQLALLSAEALRSFEDRMVDLFRTHWPEAFEAKGEPFIRSLIREELPRAQASGLVCEHDAAHYLNLVMALVIDLNTRPSSDWIEAILNDPSSSPATKLYTLYARVANLYDSTQQ